MKIPTIISILALSISAAHACVTAHVYLYNCALEGDILSAQVWDNGQQVCKGYQSKHFAGSDTVWCINGCQSGYSFCATQNGKEATYINKSGFQVHMRVDNGGTHFNSFTCGGTENHAIRGTEFESCLVGAESDCGSQARCRLCDFRSYC